MKYKYQTGLTLLFIIGIAATFYPFKEPNNLEKYEAFLASHPYHPSNHYGVNYDGKPKYDRPDLGWEQNYLMTMDPDLRRPTPEALVPVREQIKQRNKVRRSTPGTTAAPWVERGPNNVGGRTRALAWDPNDINGTKVWAGGVTGGLWYNTDITDDNIQWVKASDTWDNLSITAIAFDPNDPQIVYVGTGEGWGVQASRGMGIWKSTDGGDSFNHLTNTSDFYYVNDILVRNEGGTSVIYAALKENFYQGEWPSGQEGLMRSDDGGSSFTQVMPATTGSGDYAVADLDTAADNTLWAATQNNSFGDGGGKIFSSTDGISWTERASFTGDRVAIGAARNNANTIYALVENGNALELVAKTVDGGANWTTSSDNPGDAFEEPNDADQGITADDFTRGQAWYDLVIEVDPSDDNSVIAGGINLFKSTNGAEAWTQISKWSDNPNMNIIGVDYVHADHHKIAFKPGDATVAIFGHDGGVSYSETMNQAVPNFVTKNNHYNTTQFYSVALHPTAGSNFIIGGTQDNGSQRLNAAGLRAATEVSGGDGGYCFIDQTDPTYQITSYTNNVYFLSTDGGNSFDQQNPIYDDENSGRFINPADYDDQQDILYSARDNSSLGKVINVSTTPTQQILNVGNMGEMASHIRVSPYTTSSPSTLFVGTGAGRLFKITNANTGTPTVDEITNNINDGSQEGWISCIEIADSENRILVTKSNYNRVSVWESTDGGATWVNKEGDLPDLPVRWALYNPNDYSEVILATDLGMWQTADITVASPAWVSINNGLTNVRVDMLQYRASDDAIVAATHGRGMFTSTFADVNQAPTIVDQNFNVDENVANTTSVGTVAATDPESDNITFSITGGNDDGIFAIVADGTGEGEITIADNTNLDHETTASYSLTVRVADADNQSEATITIDINDINEAPSIQDQSFSVATSSVNGASVGTVQASDEDEGTTLTYSILSGNTNTAFAIDGSTGEITVNDNTQLIEGSDPEFVLEIQVQDDGTGNLTAQANVSIDVTNNLAPTIDNDGTTFTVAENAADGAAVGQVDVSDNESDLVTYAITAGANSDFVIDANTGAITVASGATLDFETEAQYTLTVEVTATSGNTSAVQGTFTVDITDANEAPSIDPQSMRIDENSSIGTVVINNNGTAINNAVIATDPDGDNLTYAITAGDPNNFFDINAQGQIIVQSNINYEANQNFSLTVQVTDPGSLIASATVSISVNDVNEPPVIPANQTFSISENASNNDAVGTVSATDPDALDPSFRQLTFSFSPASTVFAINNSGQITVADANQLDFDATPQYTLTVQVSDGTSPVSSTITINVDEFIGIPVVADQTFTIAENSADGATIGTVVATDPDTPLSGLSFSVISGNTGNATAIDNDGVLTIADSAAYDFETNPDFELRVRVTDGTNADTATVTIDLTNVNEAPTITNRTIQAPENLPLNSVLGDTEASDVDTQNLTYSIVSGNTGQNYALADTGTILVNNAAYFDFETFTRDTLNIRVFDGEFADTARFIIRLTNVNESLTISDSTYTIDENSANNVTVGSLKAEDIDGDALTFNIVSGNTGDAFALSGKVIVVNNTEQLDFETTPVFNLQVSATDGEFTETAAITIELNDVFELVNDKPQFFPQTFSINENQPKNTQIGTLEATDTVILVNGEPTLRNNEITYEIVNQSFPNAVALDNLTGVITVNDSAAFDYEGSSFGNFPTIVVNVRVSDGDLSTTASVTIQIFNVEEPPYIEDQVFSIPENSPAGTLVDKVKAIDGDGAGLSLRIISGNLNSAFFMSNAGTLTVQNPTPLNFEVNPQLVLVVEATDQVDTVTANITINVTDVNDPPKLTGKLFDIDENPAKGDTVGNINVIDDDGLENVIFTILEGNVQGAFIITEDGFIIVDNEDAIDFEELRTITLRVLIEDGIFTFEEIVDIQINDVIDNLLITDVEDEIQVKFYPNPVRDRLTVELPGLNDQRILISDLSGKILWQSFTNRKSLLEINTTSYRPGIYLLMVGQQVFKFRKE